MRTQSRLSLALHPGSVQTGTQSQEQAMARHPRVPCSPQQPCSRLHQAGPHGAMWGRPSSAQSCSLLPTPLGTPCAPTSSPLSDAVLILLGVPPLTSLQLRQQGVSACPAPTVSWCPVTASQLRKAAEPLAYTCGALPTGVLVSLSLDRAVRLGSCGGPERHAGAGRVRAGHMLR